MIVTTLTTTKLTFEETDKHNDDDRGDEEDLGGVFSDSDDTVKSDGDGYHNDNDDANNDDVDDNVDELTNIPNHLAVDKIIQRNMTVNGKEELKQGEGGDKIRSTKNKIEKP